MLADQRLSASVAVVGAGIIGLTTSLTLVAAGFDVTCLTSLPLASTTSNAAGAIWGPFLSEQDERGGRWCSDTIETLRREPVSAGVYQSTGFGLEPTHAPEHDWLVKYQSGAGVSDVHSRFSGYRASWTYSAPIVDMSRYIQTLAARFLREGGTLTYKTVTALGPLRDAYQHIVICAGLASGHLLGDDQVFASRGQLVIVANPGISEFICERGDGPNLTYILPQGEQLVLGGTAEPGCYDVRVKDSTTNEIIRRCSALDARIANSRIRDVRVGLRPCRSTVRLAHEDTRQPSGHIIYNYGHGGSGLSLSWGCAANVRDLIVNCHESSPSHLVAV